MDRFLKVLTWAIGLIALLYTGNALLKLYSWATYSAAVPPTSLQFSVKEISDEEFRIHARYQFLSVTQDETWEHPTFKNAWAAEQAIKTLPPLLVWYNPSNPSHSTLQKSFPLKQCIYSAMLWAIGGYFWILHCRLSRLKRPY